MRGRTNMRDVIRRILVTFIFTMAVFTILYLAVPECKDCHIGKADEYFSYSVLVNFAPEFKDNISNYVFDIGDNFTYDVNCTDQDGHNITYLDNTNIFNIDPSTGYFSKIINASDVGLWTVTISCFDSLSYTNQTFTLRVNAPPSPSRGGSSSSKPERKNDGITELISDITKSMERCDLDYKTDEEIAYFEDLGIADQARNAKSIMQNYRRYLQDVKDKENDYETRISKKKRIESDFNKLKSSTICEVKTIKSFPGNITENVIIIDTTKGLEQTHLDVLREMNFNQDQKSYIDSKDPEKPVEVFLSSEDLKVTYMDNKEGFRTIITKTVKNIGDSFVDNLYVAENVPKNIAEHVSEVLFLPEDYGVIEEDPIVRWAVGDLNKTKSVKFKTIIKNLVSPEEATSIKFIIVHGKEIRPILEKAVVPLPDDCTRTFVIMMFIFFVLIIAARHYTHDKRKLERMKNVLAVLLMVNLLFALMNVYVSSVCSQAPIIILSEVVFMLFVIFISEKAPIKMEPQDEDELTKIYKEKGF